jgi:putative heme iron utilization protein
MTKQLLTEIAEEALDFVSGQRSLQLSTVNLQGEPLASYAPFYRAGAGNYYILVSTLANHTENLQNGVASILVIADEQKSPQIFARVRLGFQCRPREVLREDSEFNDFIEKLKTRHGNVIDTLAALSDFKLYELTPVSGRYVKGFGQAYTVNAQLTQAIPVDR